MYFTGSFQEIATIIEKEWWEDKRKILTNLSRSIDFEMIENLPEDLRRNFLGREISPQEFDEENPPDDIFLFQVFKRDKGKSFEVVCSNKIRKLTKKLTKKEKDETIEILHSLSSEPTGSLLPRLNNLKTIGAKNINKSLDDIFGLRKKRGDMGHIKFYQYKCGRSLRKRLIWTIDDLNEQVVLLFYGTRNQLEKIWGS
jgi:mRNA-degrading endonuclease RelE of RelBE toxin-antitoxin system